MYVAWGKGSGALLQGEEGGFSGMPLIFIAVVRCHVTMDVNDKHGTSILQYYEEALQ